MYDKEREFSESDRIVDLRFTSKEGKRILQMRVSRQITGDTWRIVDEWIDVPFVEEKPPHDGDGK